ncbi:hypothetical protein D3C77_508910 [compost metagenome]
MIDLEVFLGDEAFFKQLIAFVQAVLQGILCRLRQAALSRLARSQAFEHTAYLDGSSDIVGTDRAYLKPASAEAYQQPFLLQGTKRHAHRHA